MAKHLSQKSDRWFIGGLAILMALSTTLLFSGIKSTDAKDLREIQATAAQPTKQFKCPDQLYFTSQIAKFKLCLPKSWQANYQVEEFIGSSASDEMRGSKYHVAFLFSPNNMKVDSSEILLRISVYSLSMWDQEKKLGGPPVGNVIVEKDNSVYVVHFPQSNPFENDLRKPHTPEGKRFNRLLKDIGGTNWYDAGDLKNRFSLITRFN